MDPSKPGATGSDRGGLPAGAGASLHLTFLAGGELCAVPILLVKEILQYQPLTRVPSSPHSVRGVMNLRGSVMPVVDLAALFGMPESGITKRTCFVIVGVLLGQERAVMGLMVDSVREASELVEAEVQPPPPFGTRIRAGYLLGMTRCEGRFLHLLDLESVLSAVQAEAGLRTDRDSAGGTHAGGGSDAGASPVETTHRSLS